jgi:dienelactone hydrolase
MLKYMRQRWETTGRKMPLTATDEKAFRNWKRALTSKLFELIGYHTMKKAELEPQLDETVDCGGFLRHHVTIQTEPNVFMPLYVLEPKDVEKPLTPIIAAHGHVSGGMVSVAGIDDDPLIRQTIRQHNYDYGRQLCIEGFLVFCPEARGFGERKEPDSDTDKLNGSCSRLNAMAYALGQTVVGMWTWDIHRLIDYIEARKDCDITKLTCLGLSGGGLQTLWAAALDERIRSAVISGYFYGFEQSLLEKECCWCNYVPHLFEYVDIGDIGALIAPRPLLIETGDQDSLNGRDGVKNVENAIDTVRQAYRIYNSEDKLIHSIQSGEHQWYGNGVVEWLQNNE